jgi:signal transduction histidine kinase/CheY-like chemotaxis protein
VVTTGIAFTLSNRFSGLYNRLGETNTTLEAAVYERTLELEKQTEIAINASRAKSEFLATMSHEIRTPLNAVIGLSEIELRGNLPPSSKSNVEQIRRSGSSLLAIVNDILDISKIEAGSFELVPVEYETAPFINGTVRLNIVRIGSKPISFILEIGSDFPWKLRGDELRVRQILNNLLSNAIKYTQEGSVTLSADWDKRGTDALLRFTVRDTGMGIRQEDVSKLFSDYTQLDTRANRKIEGTGLGLAITKKLVEMMDGGIRVESEYGKGSVFTVEVLQGLVDESPLGEDTVESLRTFRYIGPEEERNIVRSPMPYGKVLVVDDMAVNLQVARGLLEPYSLAIDTAASGLEAIEKIRRKESRYDLVFMDHMMPGMDGIEATARIRALEGDRFKDLPIIALTANALAGMKEMFLESGFNGFISKPIDAAQLDEVLNTWIRDRRTEKAEEPQIADNPVSAPAPYAALTFPAIPGIDKQRGIAMTGGTVDGYRKVLALFRQDALERLPFLRRQPEPDALPLFVTQVHALKSAAASIGAMEVSAEAARLEAAGKGALAGNAGDMAVIREALSAFAERLAALAEGIEAALTGGIENGEGKNENKEKPSVIFNSQLSILNLLASALEAQNAPDIDRLLEELSRQELDLQTRETVEQISDDVLMADYSAALDVLKQLISNDMRKD